MEQEICLKAYLQFFDSILTASKPSRTPVALNFLFISESQYPVNIKVNKLFKIGSALLTLVLVANDLQSNRIYDRYDVS